MVIHKPDCPICTVGLLLPRRRMVVQDFGRVTTILPHYYCLCDTCGMEVGSPLDDKRNAEVTQKILMRMLSA
jgi:YgiT-type zinc finger domain-containing protein